MANRIGRLWIHYSIIELKDTDVPSISGRLEYCISLLSLIITRLEIHSLPWRSHFEGQVLMHVLGALYVTVGFLLSLTPEEPR